MHSVLIWLAKDKANLRPSTLSIKVLTSNSHLGADLRAERPCLDLWKPQTFQLVVRSCPLSRKMHRRGCSLLGRKRTIFVSPGQFISTASMYDKSMGETCESSMDDFEFKRDMLRRIMPTGADKSEEIWPPSQKKSRVCQCRAREGCTGRHVFI